MVVDFSATNEIIATGNREETDKPQVSGGACSFESSSVMVVKRDRIRGFPLIGPFVLVPLQNSTCKKKTVLIMVL